MTIFGSEEFKINHRILRTKPKAGSSMPLQPVKILAKPFPTFVGKDKLTKLQ